ncbi:hypothetical protein Bca52824_055718 [Brassica carinata]|uniref:Uncharacterized protein n=1 Tax=Brassica carinata TaxID=52824 RepID=A0A8X7R864_BRACI|nr:hypothetical protein Bca52824_055718 [Brassica carinata]
MGNFEDGDNMLRNCDSTFGLDSTNNEDDMCWFSSSQPNDNTEDIKPDMMFGNQRTPMLQVEDFLNNSESNYAVEDENGYTIMGGSAQENSSENVYDTSLLEKDILMLDEEANLQKKQTDHLHHPDGKSDGYSENSFIFQHSGTSRERVDTNQYYPSSTFQQPGVPYTQFNCEQPSDQISACESNPGIKAENQPNPSSASNESYTSSNQAQSVDSLKGPTVDERCRKGFEKRVNLQPGKDLPPSLLRQPKQLRRQLLRRFRRLIHRLLPPQLLNPSPTALTAALTTRDDISLEATSFRQLQQVVEQLDVRTKLCIRDSLYRLAKSAEQRHNCMNPNGGTKEMKGAAGSHLETGETDKYVGFMDIETDTDPIDRSIAHLLFHRPSDASLSSDRDVLSYKTHQMIPHPNSSPSLRIEKEEETREQLGTEAEGVASENK